MLILHLMILFFHKHHSSGRLLPLLSRPGAVGVSLVSVESYGNFKASTSGRILVLQVGDVWLLLRI